VEKRIKVRVQVLSKIVGSKNGYVYMCLHTCAENMELSFIVKTGMSFSPIDTVSFIRYLVKTVQEGGWSPGLVGICAEFCPRTVQPISNHYTI
jgi:hypothetical protein